MQTSYRVEQGADHFANNTFRTSFGIVKKDVGNTVGHLTHCCSSDTCGKKIVDGWTVGLTEDFPCEGTHQRIEEGDTVGVPVFTCGIIEHASVERVSELVARETVVVPHPATSEILLQYVVGDVGPLSMLHKVIPAEYEGVDANVFNERLQSWQFGCAIGFLSKEMQGTGVGREGVWSLQMRADVGDGIIPDGVRLHNFCCVQRSDAAHGEEKNEMDATEFHLHEWVIVINLGAKI